MSAYTESTLQHVEAMKAAGMEPISSNELLARIEPLGYSISKALSFCYTNTLNGTPYLAKSVYIQCSKTKKSFANTESVRDNLPALQEIRRNCFVFENGRIWEL